MRYHNHHTVPDQLILPFNYQQHSQEPIYPGTPLVHYTGYGIDLLVTLQGDTS